MPRADAIRSACSLRAQQTLTLAGVSAKQFISLQKTSNGQLIINLKSGSYKVDSASFDGETHTFNGNGYSVTTDKAGSGSEGSNGANAPQGSGSIYKTTMGIGGGTSPGATAIPTQQTDSSRRENLVSTVNKVYASTKGLNDCADYLVDVAKALNIRGLGNFNNSTTNANDVVKWLKKNAVQLKGTREAASYADRGLFVVTALSSSQLNQEHGHLAIVLPGPLQTSGHWKADAPLASERSEGGGSLNFNGKMLSYGFQKIPDYYLIRDPKP